MKNEIQSVTIIKNWIRNDDDNYELKLNDLNLSEKLYIPNIVKYCNLSNNNFNNFDIDENSKLINLNISKNKLNEITIPLNIVFLDLSFNLFTKIIKSNTIQILNLSNNNLIELDLSLLPNIIDLNVSNNKIKNMNINNENLQYLDISNNELTYITDIPKNLISLKCNNNKIIKILKLNLIIQEFNCENNLLTTLPKLPNTIINININYNKINISNIDKKINIYNQIQLQMNTQVNDFYKIKPDINIKDLYIETIKTIISETQNYEDYINNIKIYSNTEKHSASDTVVISGELNDNRLNIYEKYFEYNKLNKNIFLKTYTIKNNDLSAYVLDNSLDTEIDIYNSVIYELIYNNCTPHLINYYGSNKLNDSVKYLIFEKLENLNLYSYLTNLNDISINNLYIIIFQIMYTLHCLYNKYIVHNDLHFGNILIENKNINYVYEILDYKIELVSNCCVKIFDFDRSSCYNHLCQRNFKLDNILCESFDQCNLLNYKKDISYIIKNLYIILNNKYKNLDFSEFFSELFFNVKKNKNEILKFCNDVNTNYNEINNVLTIITIIINKYKNNKSQDNINSQAQQNLNNFNIKVYSLKNKIKSIYKPPIPFNLSEYNPLLKPITISEILITTRLSSNLMNLYEIELKNLKYNIYNKIDELLNILLLDNDLNKYNIDHLKNVCYLLCNPIIYGIPNGFLILISGFQNVKMECINIYNIICNKYIILPIKILNLYGNSVYNINTKFNIVNLIQRLFLLNYKLDIVLIDKYLLKICNNLLFIFNYEYSYYAEYIFNILLDDSNIKKNVYKYYFKYFNTAEKVPQDIINKIKNTKLYLKSLNDTEINIWINENKF